MPRPIFDIHEYELRGTKPPIYSEAQFEKLNATLTRVNGQIDWTAQMLGFNGPNYWGESNPKANGEYDWKGLVETMNEKRQMQVGAYGVYNKNLDYENWPSPFNRSEIKASGDLRLGIGVSNGKTIVTPLGLALGKDFRTHPFMFHEAEYLFRGEVEVTYTGEFFIAYETVADEVWTRVRTTSFYNSLSVKLVGSDAEPFTFIVLEWRDITDWTYDEIQRNFIGIWGNKGNQLSHDFAFDALDLHGFNETYSLTQTSDILVPFSDLIEKMGLTPDALENLPYDLFSITVEGCGTFAFRAPTSTGAPYEFMRCDGCDYSITGTLIYVPADGTTGDLLLELEQIPELISTDPAELNIMTEAGNSTVVGYLYFEYIPKTPCGALNFPQVEFNLTTGLDNGTFENTSEPWLTVANGFYDQTLGCITEESGCGTTFCGFDNGEYDFQTGINETISVCITDFLKTFLRWSMAPNLQNCYTPLRLWKPQVLTTMDELSYDAEEYWNPLVADLNTGPYPEDNYRHYVRLPLEYVRNGKWWNRAIAVCNNLSYFSAPPNESHTEIEPEVYYPVLYDEEYYKKLPEDTTYYNEDYLVSTIRTDNEPTQAFYVDSHISFESDEPVPFYQFAKIEEYNPFDYRIANFITKEWTGRYYFREKQGMIPFSGFLQRDLDTQIIEERPEALNPVWDAPLVKYPDVEFPDETDLAHVKNYVVSYAYFVTDYSTADEPVFDPDSAMCWRETCLECRDSLSSIGAVPDGTVLATETPEDLETDPDENLVLVNQTVEPDPEKEVECFDVTVTNRTAYLLHNYTCY